MDMANTHTSSDAASEPGQGGMEGREYKGTGYSLYVWISGNLLECRCSYVPREQGVMITKEELLHFLADSEIREGLILEALDDFVVKAAAGQTLSKILVAAGAPPVHGVDGSLLYLAKPSVVVSHNIEDSANVDLHNVQTFINVSPGDQIARIVPPEPGTPGRGVTGKIILQHRGKALDLKIGEGVHSEEDGCLLIADVAGRVCVALGEITVAQEYIISGDVNFRVGSIVFNGFVEVRGDVLDGFNITALKGLRVNGNIGACAIRSDGDISFCGMDGQEKGSIECGGSITANFLHECSVECAGDVTVGVEIHNCQLKSLGRITVKQGAIAGGRCTALGGIEANICGSPASVKTTLNVGIDYHDLAEFKRLLAEMEENSARTRQAGTLKELEGLRKARSILAEGLLAIRNRAAKKANAKLNVKKMLYDNVFLRLGMASKERLDERPGPLSIIENSIQGGLRFLHLTSLDVRAADIELAFVREQAMFKRTAP